MSLFNGGSGGDTHHHGLLAGVSAGAVAVIVIPLLAIWLARHLVTQALEVMIWVLTACIIAGGFAGVLYLYRFIWHKHRQFSAVTPAVRAEVVPSSGHRVTAMPPPSLPEPGALPRPHREIAPAPVHLHLPEGMPLEEVAAVLGRLRAGERPELESPAP